jgi:hypothetical protein
MSGNAHAGADPNLTRQPRTFDFPTFLDRLYRPPTVVQIVRAGDILRRATELFEAVVQDSQPLPNRGVCLVESLRREFARIEDFHTQLLESAATPSAPPTVAHLRAPGAGDPVSACEAPSSIGFDPRSEIPMMLNYLHIERTAGPDAAEAALTAFVRRLRRKKAIGRPRSRGVSEIRAAKQERDRGRSWGQIARKYGFRNAKDAALAVAYHFRDQHPTKKSH